MILLKSIEDINDIIKVVESLEKPGLLIDCATETAKHQMKKQEGEFLGAKIVPMAWMTQPIASSLINVITGKGQKLGLIPLLTLPLAMKFIWKGVRRERRGYNNFDKNF